MEIKEIRKKKAGKADAVFKWCRPYLNPIRIYSVNQTTFVSSLTDFARPIFEFLLHRLIFESIDGGRPSTW